MIIRDPIQVYGKKLLTQEEYLAFERDSIEKHEYYKGEVFLMLDYEAQLQESLPYAMSGAGYGELEEYRNKSDYLIIPALNVSIPLHLIYKRTKLE